MKKCKLIIVIVMIVTACVGCTNAKDYKVVNKINPDDVLFYYVYEEIQSDARVNEYLMAYRKDNTIEPIFVLKNASYLAKIYQEAGSLYLYNDMKYFFNEDKVEAFERTLTSFDCLSGKVKTDKETGSKEGNYYFSTKTKKIEEITGITDSKVKSVIEDEQDILVQYQSNQLAILDNKQNIKKKTELKQYSLIYYILPYGDDFIVVGIDEGYEILLIRMNWELKPLQEMRMKGFDDVSLCIGNDMIYGIGKKIKEVNQFFTIDNKWNMTIQDSSFYGDNLLYLNELKEVVYYNNKSNSYVFLDEAGKESIKHPISIENERYNYPSGKLYLSQD